MRLLLTSLLGAALMLSLSVRGVAQDGPNLQVGDKVRLQLTQSFPDAPAEYEVKKVSGNWVLFGFTSSFLVRGESGVKTEPAEMWVNLAHVISVRLLPKK